MQQPLIEDQSQTDRVTLNAIDCLTLLTLTNSDLDVDFHSLVDYGRDPFTCKTQGQRSLGSTL